MLSLYLPSVSFTLYIHNQELAYESPKVYSVFIGSLFINISTADFTVVFTGPFGAGKSAACNFFMGREVFESRPSFGTVTKETASYVVTIEGKYIKLVDTPGLFDPNSIKEEECLEFAKGLISIQYGFHAIGVVLNLNTNIENDAASLFKNLLSIYNNYLPYIFLMFTHGKDLGQTDRQQKLAITKMLQGKPKDSNISKILKNINYRYLVIESIENMKEAYHACKSKELLNTVQAIFRQTGTLTNNHFALSITHSFKVTQIVLETKSTQYAQVVQEKTRDATGEEAKTKKQTPQATNASSEESNDSKNEEKSSISRKDAYESLESIVHTAMTQDKNITLVIEDKNQTKITLKISS